MEPGDQWVQTLEIKMELHNLLNALTSFVTSLLCAPYLSPTHMGSSPL
jgi:hypothetical protein